MSPTSPTATPAGIPTATSPATTPGTARGEVGTPEPGAAPVPPPRRRSGDPHHWLIFGARRLARLALSMWALVTASFLMIHLVPGDPIRAALGPGASADLVAAKREALGLDAPLLAQYGDYLRGLLAGDLGTSLLSQVPVTDVLADRLPATLTLAVLAFVTAVAVAVPVGAAAGVATRRGHGRRTELAFSTTTVVLGTIPDFLIGVGLVFMFGVQLGWLPVAGNDGSASYVLPVVALAIGPAAVLARILRIEMVTVFEADFIRTARAKRLPTRTVVLSHVLPNAATATLTVGGLILSSMVTGTVLVENVFAWPGLGNTIVQSILAKDYPVVQAIVLVYGAGVLLVNTAVDIALAVLDPRSTIKEG